MKTLFREEYETYTEEGHELSSRIKEAVESIIDEFVEKDFSIRDIEYIANSEIMLICSEKILMRNFKIHKEKKSNE